ncbi:S10 family serine carboxypeptidase-like protein [Leucobacter sp.]
MIEWQSEPRGFSAGLDANGGAGRRFTGRVERVAVTASGGRRIGTAHTISYALERRAGEDRRPVAFVFNGGPGVSSVWLHLGGVGPFRVAVPEDLGAGAMPPYGLEENCGSLLSAADLVFIDPIRTGLGRLEAGIDPDTASAAVDGAEADADHVADVIAAWLVHHGRLGDAVFLVGESYGTIRAALLATRLQHRDTAIAVSGCALIGQAVNAQETTQRPGNAVGYIAAVPFLAVTARYHGRGSYLGVPVDELADRAHRWSIERYAPALLCGDLLDPDAEREIAREFSGFCGLSVDALLARRLRVNKEDFRRELLPGRVLGLTDARYTLPSAPVGLPEPEYEPTGTRLDAAFTALIHRHLRDSLGVAGDAPYLLAAPGAHERWDYQEHRAIGAFGGSPLPSPFAVFDYAANLRAWMRANDRARLFIGTGHYDSLTTVGAACNLLSQHALPRDRVTLRCYEGGHMMYSDRESARRLGADLRAFIAGAAVPDVVETA